MRYLKFFMVRNKAPGEPGKLAQVLNFDNSGLRLVKSRKECFIIKGRVKISGILLRLPLLTEQFQDREQLRTGKHFTVRAGLVAVIDAKTAMIILCSLRQKLNKKRNLFR